MRAFLLCASLVFCSCAASGNFDAKNAQILNVSFDATRSVYQKINVLFEKKYLDLHKTPIKILQSHGGSGKQARSVLEGLDADLVSLALGYDIDILASQGKLLDPNWQSRFANNSCPAYSIVVFLVRQGNPKQIKDWQDLARSDVKVLSANPKTSGGARWNFLALWAWALETSKTEDGAKDVLVDIFGRMPLLPSGSRAALSSFTKQGIGDVLMAWETDAVLATKQSPDQFEIVYPTISIKAETPVATVDRVAKRRGSQDVANEYLAFLFSPEGQAVFKNEGFRLESDKNPPSTQRLLSIKDFGTWPEVQKRFFADGGVFDQIYEKANTK